MKLVLQLDECTYTRTGREVDIFKYYRSTKCGFGTQKTYQVRIG